MTSVEMPPATKPPGPSLRLSIVLIIVGIALALPTFIAGIVPIVRETTSEYRFNVPNVVRLNLGTGRYMVFEDTGSSSPFSTGGNVTLTPQNVTVTDPDGQNVEVFESGGVRETRTSQGNRFLGAVEFTTTRSGEYTVRVTSSSTNRVLVARPLGDTIEHALGWFGLAVLGGLICVTGIILLIVGSVRRNRSRTAFAYAVPVPPGWHPDPGGSGRWRYWDGYRWTEHLQ